MTGKTAKTRKIGYLWHLRRLMADKDMYATTDLVPCWPSGASPCPRSRSTGWLPARRSASAWPRSRRCATSWAASPET